MIILSIHLPSIVITTSVVILFSCGVSFWSVGRSSRWVSVFEVINFIYVLFKAVKIYSYDGDYMTKCIWLKFHINGCWPCYNVSRVRRFWSPLSWCWCNFQLYQIGVVLFHKSSYIFNTFIFSALIYLLFHVSRVLEKSPDYCGL